VITALSGAPPSGGADQLGRFGIDQLLVKLLDREVHAVGEFGEFQLGKQIEQGRLVKSHHVVPSV